MKTALNLSTPFGFYNTYFQLLPLYKTEIEAFNYLNDEVKRITNKTPYKSFKEFRNKTTG